jgi:hypothetical protein
MVYGSTNRGDPFIIVAVDKGGGKQIKGRAEVEKVQQVELQSVSKALFMLIQVSIPP